MRTTIIQMLRFGGFFSVKLECGCRFRVSAETARRDQLFIGKPMDCADCGAERQ